jgi:hypothetical protein
MGSNILQGPGNLTPYTEKQKFLLAGTVAKGDVLTFSGATGYTVIIGSNILTPIGVAAQAGVAGDWIDVIVHGFCDYLTCTTTDVTASMGLYAAASGDCFGLAPAASGATPGHIGHPFGIALQDQTGTTITAAWIFKNI